MGAAACPGELLLSGLNVHQGQLCIFIAACLLHAWCMLSKYSPP